jgi:putative tryptophan/tyrosine transport system substrate-binding protein
VKRQDFIAAVGALVACPSVQAQQFGKRPTIGFLGATTASVATQRAAAFAQRLRELGWTEGRTVEIVYRWADGKPERFGELASELYRANCRRDCVRW